MRSVSFQQVALIAVVLAAVILANIFAPGIAASIVSLVGALIAWLVPAPKGTDKIDPGAGIILIGLTFAGAVVIAGCDAFTGGYVGTDKLENRISQKSDMLEHCKQVARAARNADASPEDSLAAFDNCVASDGGAK